MRLWEVVKEALFVGFMAGSAFVLLVVGAVLMVWVAMEVGSFVWERLP